MAGGTRSSFRWVWLLAALAAIAVTFVAGRASVPTDAAPAFAEPTRIVDGVSIGFPHTPAGADAAAAHYLVELERAMDTLDATRTASVASIVATQSEAQTIRAHASDVIGLERSDGPPLRRVAIATDLLSYSSAEAEVTVLEGWFYARVNQEAVWAIERVSLVWRREDWRIAEIAGAAPSSNESLSELRAQLEFSGVGDASVR